MRQKEDTSQTTKLGESSKLSLASLISVGQRHAGHTTTISGKYSDPHYQTLGATFTSTNLQQKKCEDWTKKTEKTPAPHTPELQPPPQQARPVK